MARSIIAVVVSYIAMFALTFILFTGMYLLLGADGAFKPGNYEPTALWLGLSFVVFLVIGIIAGLLCAAIAKGGRAHIALAIVVLVLGILLAIPSLIAQKAETNLVRTGNVSTIEGMSRAKEPVWSPFVFPLIGAAGVLIGESLNGEVRTNFACKAIVELFGVPPSGGVDRCTPIPPEGGTPNLIIEKGEPCGSP